uniref:Uncharacterized protein n=1 Tax=Parascaris univalens TaxID=6257 RepID=A0A915BGP9_PARUN
MFTAIIITLSITLMTLNTIPLLYCSKKLKKAKKPIENKTIEKIPNKHCHPKEQVPCVKQHKKVDVKRYHGIKTAKEASRKLKNQKRPKSTVGTSNTRQRLKGIANKKVINENKTQKTQNSIDITQPMSIVDQHDTSTQTMEPLSSHDTLNELVPIVRFRQRHEEIMSNKPAERKDKEYGTLKFIDFDSTNSTLDICIRELCTFQLSSLFINTTHRRALPLHC